MLGNFSELQSVFALGARHHFLHIALGENLFLWTIFDGVRIVSVCFADRTFVLSQSWTEAATFGVHHLMAVVNGRLSSIVLAENAML